MLLGDTLSFCYSVFRVLRAAHLQLYAPVLGQYTSHLLSTAPPSSRARTVDAWEVPRSYELRAVCTLFYSRDTRSTTS